MATTIGPFKWTKVWTQVALIYLPRPCRWPRRQGLIIFLWLHSCQLLQPNAMQFFHPVENKKLGFFFIYSCKDLQYIMIALKYIVFKLYDIVINMKLISIKWHKKKSRIPCLLHLHHKTCLLNASQPRYGLLRTPNVREFFRSEKYK